MSATNPRPAAAIANTGAAGLPPWLFAAGGGAAALFVVLAIALILALSSRSPAPASTHAGLEDALISRPAPRPVVAAEATIATPALPPPAALASAPATPTPAPTALTTAQIVKRCEPSVALIKGKVSSGTGFMVGYGVMATNAHVIEDEFVSNLEVRFPSAPAGNQGPIHAQLLYEDRKRDLAFLAVKSDLPVLRVAPNYVFVKGEDILVIGNPGLGSDVVLENAISRGVMSAKTVIEGMNYHQMNISINPGNSGGPVFDSQGRVIGVATLKSNKTEAMGFSIPVEDVSAALAKVNTPRPDPGSRHRATVAFRILTVAGALYAVALDTRAGILRSAPAGGSNANLLPTEEFQKLHDALISLDQKLFSLVAAELTGLATDPGLDHTAQRGFPDLSDNYQAMKKLYNNPNRLADQFSSQIENLKAQHLRLIESLQKTLNVEVPPKLLAALQPRSMNGQPPTMVTDFVPFQFQPRFLPRPPGFGPQGPIVPGPGLRDPLQAAREQHERMLKRMQDMRNRSRGFRGGPP